MACNEDNNELYVGTNSGCIIVAEAHSLKPITVFRPFNHEVKFIITFPEYFAEADNEAIRLEEVKLSFEEKPGVGRNALRSLHQVWPFGKKKEKNILTDKTESPVRSPKNAEPKRRKPFVTIGRGYRNLLDRFIYKSSDASNSRQSGKLKDANTLHGIIWDSGNWNVE